MDDRRYPSYPIPGVGAVVFGEQGVLLVRRHKNPGKGLWSVPGGGVEVGESQIEAVQREVLEETGVQCTVVKFLSTYDIILPDDSNKTEFHFLLNHYLAKAETVELTPEVPEAEVAWFKLDALPVDEMPPAVIDLIETGRREMK
ncbi:MAG: NUDIX hydrolase [Candidatus Thorarchaeota archaeon]|jgi:ADP-ribose pyrophosphatase YjhB (NUDIX family)